MDVRRLHSALARREFRLDPRMGHLVHLERGSALLTGKQLELAAGQIAWLAPGRAETLRIEAGAQSVSLSLPRLELARIVAQGDGGGQMAPLAQVDLTAALPRAQQQRMALLFDDIAAELATPRQDSQLVAEAACTLLLIGFLRLVRPEGGEGHRPPLAERFMLLAAQHWHEHWAVASYAEALGVTRFQLNSAMRRHAGCSPQDHLQRQLIDKAMALLEQTPLRIAAIAYRLGFQDPAYFSRVFQRQTGQTPGKWRSARKGAERPSFAAWP